MEKDRITMKHLLSLLLILFPTLGFSQSYPSYLVQPVRYFDASAPSTIYDATTGGSPVSIGGAVVGWEDVMGSGIRATQSIVASRPTRQDGYIMFDGVNDYLSENSLAPLIGQGDDTPFTVITVVRPHFPISMSSVVWSWGDSTSLNYRHNVSITTGSVLNMARRDGTTIKSLSGTSVLSSVKQIHTHVFTGTVGDIFLNGNLEVSGDLDVNTMGSVPNIFGIGALVRSNVQSFYFGEYYALLVYNQILSSKERTDIENWIRVKYFNAKPFIKYWDYGFQD